MKTAKSSRSKLGIFLFVLFVCYFLNTPINTFAQCTTCNSTISANSGPITVPNNQTYCIISPAIPGDITITGAISLGTNSNICVLANGGDIIINGNLSFSAGSTFSSYSTNPTDTIKFKGQFLNPTGPASNIGYVNNSGTLLIDPPTAGGTISFPSKMEYSNTGNMILNSTFSSNANSIVNSGTLDIIGKANFLSGTIANSGTLNALYPLGAIGDNGLTIGGFLTNSGVINSSGHTIVTTSGGFTNTSTGYTHTIGNFSINGIFNNYNMVDVEASLILNSGTGIDISNGSFRSYDLYIQKGGITATGGTCASFLVYNHSEVSSSPTFTGTVYIQDLTNALDSIDANNGCGSCNFTSGTADGTCPNKFLPVSFIEFKALKSNDKNILFWSTGIELNNKYYVIEKSLDGISFNSIDTVNGNIKSSDYNHYHLFDYDINYSIIYYRLKQVDIDGTFYYSPIVKIENSVLNFSLSPNPSNGNTSITIFSLINEVFYFNIKNNLGALLFEGDFLINKGENSIPLHLHFLAKGNYILTGHTSNGHTVTKNIIIY